MIRKIRVSSLRFCGQNMNRYEHSKCISRFVFTMYVNQVITVDAVIHPDQFQ